MLFPQQDLLASTKEQCPWAGLFPIHSPPPQLQSSCAAHQVEVTSLYLTYQEGPGICYHGPEAKAQG